MTLVLVTREFDLARDVGDRVVFLDGGGGIEEAPADDVIDDLEEDGITRHFLGLVREH